MRLFTLRVRLFTMGEAIYPKVRLFTMRVRLFLGLERNTKREGNLSNVPKGNFVSAEVKLEK